MTEYYDLQVTFQHEGSGDITIHFVSFSAKNCTSKDKLISIRKNKHFNGVLGYFLGEDQVSFSCTLVRSYSVVCVCARAHM